MVLLLTLLLVWNSVLTFLILRPDAAAWARAAMGRSEPEHRRRRADPAPASAAAPVAETPLRLETSRPPPPPPAETIGYDMPSARDLLADVEDLSAGRSPDPFRPDPPASAAVPAPPGDEAPAPARPSLYARTRASAGDPPAMIEDDRRSTPPDAIEAPAPPPPVAAAPDLLADYNAIADDFNFYAVDAFRTRWRPVGLRIGDSGCSVRDDNGPLWLIETGDGRGTLLPSAEVAQNWSKFYRSLEGAEAKRELGAAFDLESGSALAIGTAAEVRVDGDRLSVVRRGELSGI